MALCTTVPDVPVGEGGSVDGFVGDPVMGDPVIGGPVIGGPVGDPVGVGSNVASTQ